MVYNYPCLERQIDCPLKQVEHLSFRVKVRGVDNLSDEEKEAILE